MNDRYRDDDCDDVHDPERPGDDISGDSMGSARQKSRECGLCNGDGWVTIYHCNFTGEPVVKAWDGYREKLKTMRSVAYCTCAAGRKMMFLHQESKERDAMRRVPDANEIAAGRYPEWSFDDPMARESMTAAELSRLPVKLRGMLNNFGRG